MTAADARTLRSSPAGGIADRIIGDLGSVRDGPTLIAVGGIHGNEPAGSEGLERLAGTLRGAPWRLKGRFLALRGHRAAVGPGVRYIEADLNRLWSRASIERILERPEEVLRPEERELRELHGLIAGAVGEAGVDPVYFMDLHTTSAPSIPFAVINDAIRCRDFALHLPVPIILGLEEFVTGTIADFAFSLGCIAVGFEAGQHDDPSSIEIHEAAVRVGLSAAGILSAEAAGEVAACARRLREASAHHRRFVEIVHRHPVIDGTGFEMEAGFENLAPVEADRLLAHDDGRALRADRAGLIFMPLYQAQGDDGYFLVRAVSPFWLWLSRRLRGLGCYGLVRRLPGVRVAPADRREVLVNPRVARVLRRQVLHLLGYRRIGSLDGREVYRRRD